MFFVRAFVTKNHSKLEKIKVAINWYHIPENQKAYR